MVVIASFSLIVNSEWQVSGFHTIMVGLSKLERKPNSGGCGPSVGSKGQGGAEGSGLGLTLAANASTLVATTQQGFSCAPLLRLPFWRLFQHGRCVGASKIGKIRYCKAQTIMQG